MICEVIDLYEYFGKDREGKTGGYLYTYARGDCGLPRIRPAVLVVPGGAYKFVSAREWEPVALKFVQEGFAAFALEYTVFASYPTPLLEGAMAMAYLRTEAYKYSFDPNKLAAVGFSAGGHLTGMLATLWREPCVKKYLPGKSVRPDAVVLSYPVITLGEHTHRTTSCNITGGDAALEGKLSLERAVTQTSSPMFIWHTVADDLVPVENSLLMAQACRKAGVPFELHLFETGAHGLATCDRETCGAAEEEYPARQWVDLAIRWLRSRGFYLRRAE